MNSNLNFKKKKIVIIGTGFSSLISAIIAISKGYKPIILESSSNSKRKVGIYKKNYFYNSNFFGGLSNFWGGAISKTDKADKKNIYNNKKFLKYFLIVDKLFKQYGKKDKYSEYFNLNTNLILSKQKNINIIKKKKIIFGASRIAINKKKLFNTREIFFKLFKEKKIKIIFNFKVTKFKEFKNKVVIYSSNNKKMICNKLFIGAGSFNTANIFMNSFNKLKKIYLKENSINYALIFFRKKISFINNNSYCDFYMTKVGKENYHNQIYLLKDKFLRKIKSYSYFYYMILKLLHLIFENKIILVFNYMGMNISKQIELTKNNNIISVRNIISKDKKNNYYSQVKNDLKNVFKKYFPFLIILKSSNFGDSNHYGSSFPFKKSKKISNSTDLLGRYKNLKNIHIIDSSSMPSLPTNTLTYTLMVHSARITDKSL